MGEIWKRVIYIDRIFLCCYMKIDIKPDLNNDEKKKNRLQQSHLVNCHYHPYLQIPSQFLEKITHRYQKRHSFHWNKNLYQ